MSLAGHRFHVDMSGFAVEASELMDGVPEVFIVICLRQKFRRLQISSEGIVSGFGDVNLEPVNARFCCSFRDLELPELSHHCFGEMISFLDVDPLIRDSLVDEMARKGCEIVRSALEGGVRRVLISADLRMVETSLFVFEEEEAAWAVRESLDLAERRGFGAVPASKMSIQSLMRCKYGSTCTEQSTCSICLNEFFLRSYIVQMPCSHIFHDRCLSRWLEQNHVCPLCRFELPPERI